MNALSKPLLRIEKRHARRGPASAEGGGGSQTGAARRGARVGGRLRITFHGAAQQVTGSAHLLEVGPHRILLDCVPFSSPRPPVSAVRTSSISRTLPVTPIPVGLLRI